MAKGDGIKEFFSTLAKSFFKNTPSETNIKSFEALNTTKYIKPLKQLNKEQKSGLLNNVVGFFSGYGPQLETIPKAVASRLYSEQGEDISKLKSDIENIISNFEKNKGTIETLKQEINNLNTKGILQDDWKSKINESINTKPLSKTTESVQTKNLSNKKQKGRKQKKNKIIETTNTQNIEDKTKEIIETLKNTNEELTTLSKFSTEDQPKNKISQQIGWMIQTDYAQSKGAERVQVQSGRIARTAGKVVLAQSIPQMMNTTQSVLAGKDEEQKYPPFGVMGQPVSYRDRLIRMVGSATQGV